MKYTENKKIMNEQSDKGSSRAVAGHNKDFEHTNYRYDKEIKVRKVFLYKIYFVACLTKYNCLI